jgi:2-O-methyltransferase
MQIDRRNSWLLIQRCLRLASPANVVVEIGAFNGDDTKRIYTMARKPVRQFTFEPDPRNIEKVRRANIAREVQIVQAAVGATDGKAKFYLSSGWDCSSSLRAPKEHIALFPRIGFNETCEVDVVTLDKFFGERKIDGIDFMWIDAQGAERDIVAGGKKTLEQSRFMYLERADHELYEGQWVTPEMITDLNALGWKCEALFDNDALFYNTRFFPTSPLQGGA